MAYLVTMERDRKPRSGIAMGGLGCGWFELRQDGQCYDWRIFNNRPVGMGSVFRENPHSTLFFLIRYQVQGATPRLCLLQIEESHGVAGLEGHEFQYIFPWISGVDSITYEASFPFAKLQYSDKTMPLEVELSAWSPFIPRNAKDSALPAAFFDFRVRSTCGKPVEVSLLASMRNWTGYDVKDKVWANRVVEDPAWGKAFEMSCTGMNTALESFGSMGIASLHPDSHHYCGWGHPHPYYERLLRESFVFSVDDTPARNEVDPQTGLPWAKHACFSTIGRTVRLAQAGDELEHTFVVTWDFPNRRCRRLTGDEPGPVGYLEASEDGPAKTTGAKSHNEGHYYSNFFSSAAEVASYTATNAPRLREETRRFHEAFFASSLPGYALDQINSNLNTFRTSSWFTRDGNFGILEGLSPARAFAGLSTVDVAMYGGISTAALFPELERAIIRSHQRFQNEDGSIVHSILQNFREKNPKEASGLRLDLPAQYAYQALRAGLWYSDHAFLAEIWPSVKDALEYGLRERDQNGDGLPDMAGVMCSYDNFPMYGVAPYVATQWLAAYSAAAATARLLGDSTSEKRYRDLLTAATPVLEEKTWNGSYYRLYAHGEKNDEGCLSDQIIGQWAIRLLDLPTFLDPERVRAALRAILRLNYHPDQGLRNCQWPQDTFLHDVDKDCWVDQANTCWSGVELAFASLLIFEGLATEGLEIIRNVDERYRRWGTYWDHQEFGGHYFRPMSAWSIIPAALGFSAVNDVVTFDPKITSDDHACRLLFVTSDGYGHFRRDGESISIDVRSGSLRIRKLRIRAAGLPVARKFSIAGMDAALNRDGDYLTTDFLETLAIPAGEAVVIVSDAPTFPVLQPA
jgi:non-lysosomal glucosylceramidase